MAPCSQEKGEREGVKSLVDKFSLRSRRGRPHGWFPRVRPRPDCRAKGQCRLPRNTRRRGCVRRPPAPWPPVPPAPRRSTPLPCPRAPPATPAPGGRSPVGSVSPRVPPRARPGPAAIQCRMAGTQEASPGKGAGDQSMDPPLHTRARAAADGMGEPFPGPPSIARRRPGGHDRIGD